MRVLRAVAVTLLSAIAGGVLAIFVGDYLTQLFHVPNMEGQRGMMVFFACLPIGILAGFVTGVVVSVCVLRRRGFLMALGLSIVIVAAVGALVGGIPYLLSDKPPRIDGEQLELEFQLRVPPSIKIPDQPDGYSVRVALYVDNIQSCYAFIDWNSIAKDSEHTTISGKAPIETHSKIRSLLASFGNEPGASQFLEIQLPPSPRRKDENWSDWVFATQLADLSAVPEPDRFAIRYRVQPVRN